MKLTLIALVASASAFSVAPRTTVRSVARAESSDTYWDGEAPPSKVLGTLAKVPSGLLAPLSVVSLAVGCYCVQESQLAAPLSAVTVNPLFIAGSLGVPISWGLHVAAWIQKKNGM
eukprot:CAMPEP_0184084180 /NCGR_PEP_ID=MMETSP0974-20121125/4078_1 /TAXON_ID=483370 /ORGANISM="non described non described, Strain CCMP2097" /LENGTH=115 /DNA_ID=CAMNT_0026386857 /DNA_START=52 /DNA_END=399 /DNA_ORIENTATION=+